MVFMVRHIGLFVVAVLFGLIMGGCGQLGEPAYPTPQLAVEEQFRALITVVHEEQVGLDRILLFHRSDPRKYSMTYVTNVGQNRWRFEGGTKGGELRDLGPVSYEQFSLGKLRTKNGTATSVTPKVHAIYGVINDPTVTWVEATLSDLDLTQRTDVREGFWVIQFPYQPAVGYAPNFSLRGGNSEGELFSIDDVHEAPLD